MMEGFYLLMHRVILSLLILIILGGLFQPDPSLLAANPTNDTSVVTLLLKSDATVIENDPLFEILDLENTILIPVNKLSSRFEMQLDFHREQNQLLLTCKKTQRQVTINFNTRTYLVNQESKWSEQPPLILNGDFYVTPQMIEYLANVKYDWSYKYQELVFQGDWKTPVSSGQTGNSSTNSKSTNKDVSYQEGAACSFGTVRYELSWKYQEDAAGLTTSEGSLAIRGDGRAGQWAISLGGSVDYENNEFAPGSAELSLIRAKYNDNNKMIILGDSDIYLQNTLQQQSVRGILVMSSENAFSRFLTPYTTVSGPAEPGDKVVLYLNGKAYNELEVLTGQDHYQFEDVPLTVKRLNVLKIVIEKPSGERLVTQQTLSSSLRILNQATNEWMVTGGSYRYCEDDAWNKQLAAFKVQKALTNNLSIDSEVVQTRHNNRTYYGADTGVAFRLGQNMICTLDWLVGGKSESPKQGWEASVIHCLEKGYLQGLLFYIDPTITEAERVQADPGRGFKLLGEIAVNDKSTYQAKVNWVKPLSEISKLVSRDFELKRNRKYGANLQNFWTLGLKQERTETFSPTSPAVEDLSEIYVDQSVCTKNTNYRNYLAFDQIKTQERNSTFTNELSYEADYINMMSESHMLNLSAKVTHRYGDSSRNTLNLESDFKWLSQEQSAGLYAQTAWIGYTNNSTTTHIPFAVDTLTVGLWGKRYFTPERSIDASWDWNIYEGEAQYYCGSLNFTQTINNNRGKIYAEYDYVSPFSYSSSAANPTEATSRSNRKAHHAYRLGVKHTTKKGLEIQLEMQRLYDNLTVDASEKRYSLTCSQAIGFSGFRFKTIANDDEDNPSFISGIVYLDENGNGQYDKNEKGLSNIRLSLNGRQITTDKKGEYIYKNVAPDAYTLFFDLRTLPADYTPLCEARLFKLKTNENCFFDFGITLNGSISGKIFLDQNGNKIYDKTEQPINWVAVILDNGKKKVFTGNDGVFYFENVPLGEHTIEISLDTLPKDLEIAGRTAFTCKIRETELDVREIEVPIVYKFKQ